MAKIIKIEQAVPVIQTKKKVAAYARVSMESERMNHSLSAQISYYSSLIQKNPGWQYAGVYADYGITGTLTAKREQFQKCFPTARRENRYHTYQVHQPFCEKYGRPSGNRPPSQIHRRGGAV